MTLAAEIDARKKRGRPRGEIAGEIELLRCVDGIRVEVAGGESKILDMAP